MSIESQRYIGMDIHKHFIMVVGLNADHQVILYPRGVSTKRLATWAKDYLLPTDQVIMEATTNIWVLHDLVRPPC